MACLLVAFVSFNSNDNGNPSSNIPVTSVAACFLSFMTCGVAWWTVLAIIITTICDDDENEDPSGTNSSSIVGFTNFTTNGTDSGLDDVTSGKDTDESVNAFCEHNGWSLAFTIASAMLWTLTASLVLIQLLQPPPPPVVRRQQGREDDDTVGTTDHPDLDNDEEWSHTDDGNEAFQGQVHTRSSEPHASSMEGGTREGQQGEC